MLMFTWDVPQPVIVAGGDTLFTTPNGLHPADGPEAPPSLTTKLALERKCRDTRPLLYNPKFTDPRADGGKVNGGPKLVRGGDVSGMGSIPLPMLLEISEPIVLPSGGPTAEATAFPITVFSPASVKNCPKLPEKILIGDGSGGVELVSARQIKLPNQGMELHPNTRAVLNRVSAIGPQCKPKLTEPEVDNQCIMGPSERSSVYRGGRVDGRVSMTV
jgi:hypothetical protein